MTVDNMMTKSELIKKVSSLNDQISSKDVKLAIKILLQTICYTLARGERIEIRRFGSFSIKAISARMAVNPKTGETLHIGDRCIPRFKPSKELKTRANN